MMRMLIDLAPISSQYLQESQYYIFIHPILSLVSLLFVLLLFTTVDFHSFVKLFCKEFAMFILRYSTVFGFSLPYNATSTACQLAVIDLDHIQSYAAFLSRYERKLRICKLPRERLSLIGPKQHTIFTIKLKASLIYFQRALGSIVRSHTERI